jgi:hypothetical protein
MEFHATGAEVVEHRYQVAQTAAQPVELPHNKGVAVFQPLQAAEQGRALRRGSRYSLILEDGFAPGLLQRGELQRGFWSSVETRA